LQDKYEKQFQKDSSNSKTITLLTAMGSITSILMGLFEKKDIRDKKVSFIGGALLGAGALVSYLCRPQKAKYDAQVDIDLKKGNINEN